MLDGVADLRSSLPGEFFDKFTDEAERAHARLVEAWAIAHGLQFAAKDPGNELPTWYVSVSLPGLLEPILTVQTSRTIINKAGRRQVQGVSDVPFHRQTSPFLRAPGSQGRLLKDLHSILPQGKALDLADLAGYWPFTWRALVQSRAPGAFLAVLERAVNGVKSP
jgi:hypothetical protein